MQIVSSWFFLDVIVHQTSSELKSFGSIVEFFSYCIVCKARGHLEGNIRGPHPPTKVKGHNLHTYSTWRGSFGLGQQHGQSPPILEDKNLSTTTFKTTRKDLKIILYCWNLYLVQAWWARCRQSILVQIFDGSLQCSESKKKLSRFSQVYSGKNRTISDMIYLVSSIHSERNTVKWLPTSHTRETL